MNTFRRLRSSPHFAKLFAFVHPFFWQVRVWSLHRLLRAYRAADVENLLYSTNPYGIIRIVFTCDKRKPAATPWWRPETTCRRWNDPALGTSLPPIPATAAPAVPRPVAPQRLPALALPAAVLAPLDSS